MIQNIITLDRASPTPIAEQIFSQITRAILVGTLAPGEKLPPERELAEHLGVSRGTVKRAYTRLAETRAIDIRQGSGSYVLKNGTILEQNQKKEAARIIAATFGRLREMGLSDREIMNLVNLQQLSSASRTIMRKASIMVVSNNHDILSELEQQFAYLTESTSIAFTLSFMTLDTIAGSPDPVQLLMSYDRIIATSIDYPDIVRLAPMFTGKILEAGISPRTKTLMEISTIPQGAKVSVVYRTQFFRQMVVQSLLGLGFAAENILAYSEKDYSPASHGDGGVAAVLNFNESPVYLDPAFRQRNEEFTTQGGKIIRFEYQIERGSLVYIEDQIQRLVSTLE